MNKQIFIKSLLAELESLWQFVILAENENLLNNLPEEIKELKYSALKESAWRMRYEQLSKTVENDEEPF